MDVFPWMREVRHDTTRRGLDDPGGRRSGRTCDVQGCGTAAGHGCVSAMPVVGEDGRVVGVVSEADLILRDESFGVPWLPDGWMQRALRRKAHARTAGELMTTPAITVGPEADVSEAAVIMRKHGSNSCRCVMSTGICWGWCRAPNCSASSCVRTPISGSISLSYCGTRCRSPSTRCGSRSRMVWSPLKATSSTAYRPPRPWRGSGRSPASSRWSTGSAWTHDDSVIAQGPIPWVGF